MYLNRTVARLFALNRSYREAAPIWLLLACNAISGDGDLAEQTARREERRRTCWKTSCRRHKQITYTQYKPTRGAGFSDLSDFSYIYE
jgi:hypothetical protein